MACPDEHARFAQRRAGGNRPHIRIAREVPGTAPTRGIELHARDARGSIRSRIALADLGSNRQADRRAARSSPARRRLRRGAHAVLHETRRTLLRRAHYVDVEPQVVHGLVALEPQVVHDPARMNDGLTSTTRFHGWNALRVKGWAVGPLRALRWMLGRIGFEIGWICG
jgi:hypothetical protein